MEKSENSKKLLIELCRLDNQIKNFNITEIERRNQKADIYTKYNKNKEIAEIILGLLAEKKDTTISKLYKERNITFDK